MSAVVDVHGVNEQSDAPVDLERWRRLAERVLEAEGVMGGAELSLVFVDEAAIAALNERFLGRAGPTDVLAFPIEDDVLPAGRFPDSGGPSPTWEPPEEPDMPLLLGDVVICPAVAAANAPTHAATYDDEVALLVVHGILHLLGMDHGKDEDAEAMEEREAELIERFHRSPAARPR